MRRVCLLFVVLAFGLGACADDSGVRAIAITPETGFGKGVYSLHVAHSVGPMTWSPKEDILLGLEGRTPYLTSDCVPLPVGCWLIALDTPDYNSEISLIDFETQQRYRVIRTPTEGKRMSQVYWFPDGRHVAYVAGREVNQGDQVGTWSVDINGHGDERMTAETLEVVWARDGSKYLVEREGSIFVTTGFGAAARELYHQPFAGAELHGMSWSADGRTVAASYGDPRAGEPALRPKIHLVDVESGETRILPGDPYDQYTRPVLSPTRDLVVFSRSQPRFNRDSTVIRDLSTDCQSELPMRASWPVSWSADGSKLMISTAEAFYIIDLAERFGTDFAQSGALCQ